MSIYKQVVSCFPGVLLMGLVRSAENFKAFPRLTFPITYAPVQTKLLSPHPPRLDSPNFYSFSPSYSSCHLYSWRPNSTHRNEMLHRPRCACFLPADTKEAITARRGQIGWGSYLGRIMFDILHHYQLPPSPPQESYLSLADVPLSVMNFLYPPLLHLPTSDPPYLSTPSSSAERVCVCGKKGRWLMPGVTANKMANII